MLERIKKRQYVGFKEFVINLETTNLKNRIHIVNLAILEDPVFMTYALKNMKSYEDIILLPSFELEKIFNGNDQIVTLFAKSLVGSSDQHLINLKNVLPHYFKKISDEFNYLNGISSTEIEGARLHLIKIVRKLQLEEQINGFSWRLPPLEIFNLKIPNEGLNQIFFETGILAAEGLIFKTKREGDWKHFYETGKLFAQGEYSDGLKSGCWTYYFGDGSLRSRGFYNDDLKQGVWLEWDKNGEVTEAHYKDNLKII